MVKMKNGNGGNKILKIVHWNMGAKFWHRKTDAIEAFILDNDPDILFISEANIMPEHTDEQKHIPGYTLVLPNTMVALGYARIALHVKIDIEFKSMSQYMYPGTSSIWISVGSKGRKALRIGGLYREQQLIRQGPANTSGAPNLQLARWNLQLDGWKAAASGNSNCLILGYSLRVPGLEEIQGLNKGTMKLEQDLSLFLFDNPPPPLLPDGWKSFEYNWKFKLANKIRNKMVKMKNGNGGNKILKIVHWNMGAKFWHRKTDAIEAFILDNDPDILFISEANIMPEHTDEQKTHSRVHPGAA